MQARDILRILALVLVVLATGALVVGACSRPAPESASSSSTTPAKRADPAPPPPPPMVTEGESADGGVRSETDPKKPGPSKAPPKGRKGMLGQMHLQGGD